MKQNAATVMPFIQQYIAHLWMCCDHDDAVWVPTDPTVDPNASADDIKWWNSYVQKYGPRVIWTPVTGSLPSRPETPYIALNLYDLVEESQVEEKTDIDGGTVLTTYRTPTAGTLHVEMMGSTDPEGPDDSGLPQPDAYADVISTLGEIQQRVYTNDFVDKAFANGVAFTPGSVSDIAALLNGVEWEPRGAVDMKIRFTSLITQKNDIIEKVRIEGNYYEGDTPLYNEPIEIYVDKIGGV